MNDIDAARRPRTVLWIGAAAAAALVLVVAAGVLLLTRGGPHNVTFEIASSGEKVSSIIYGSGDKQLGKDVGAAAAAPWSKSYEISDTSGKLWLHALSPAGGAITCTIWVDNKVVMEATALSGAVCEIPFGDALDQ
ncbi:hypothetical protein [Actinoplanes friuliensis]|uniref:Uncharacterized protein n=1 Tax=Actinoplanes friuliensis DSM 7358 TaxID=1246995 RepID=U5VXM5_9ACTN|nr:hypothetical protein [Actinoplanes friuliensis]AGZ41728.1 hypothetical protein AFR_17250 [Actinoplanes friuliensis DSM 7358]